MKRITTIFVFLFSVSVGAAEMLGIGKACVFSSLKARILEEGKPLANVRVRREWEWNSPGSDESITDEEGYVTFPAVFESSISRLLPVETVIFQRISVEVDGVFKEIWINDKRSTNEGEEYGGMKFDVTCELTNKPLVTRDDNTVGLGKRTICRLKGE